MNYLFVGYLTDVAISYLGIYAKTSEIKFYAIDHRTQNIYSDMGMTYGTFYDDKITIENVTKLFKETTFDKVINFYEVKEANSLEEYNKENYEFVISLHKLCEEYKVKQFIQISTSDVYGTSSVNICNEEKELVSTSHYTTSKINAEKYLENKKDVTIIRMCDVFGVRYDNNLLNNFINAYEIKGDLIVREDKDYVRGYLDIKDCVYYLHILFDECKYGVFNVSSLYFISATQLVDMMKKELKIRKPIIYTKSKKVVLNSVKLDNEKLVQTTNYQAENQKTKLIYYIKQFI